MTARGLEAWIPAITRHGNVGTPAELRAMTAEDLEGMAERANMRLDAATIRQVLGAIRRRIPSEELRARPRQRSVSGDDEGTDAAANDYLTHVGLDAWRVHFTCHIPRNMASIEDVRATTAADLRRMAARASMTLDAATIQQVLNALKKEPKKEDSKPKAKLKRSEPHCSRDCGFTGAASEVEAHEVACKHLSKEARAQRRSFCIMLKEYSTCLELYDTIDLPGKAWWDERQQPEAPAPAGPNIKQFLKARGLEAWIPHLQKHLDIKTADQARALKASDLRRMGTKANMRLDQKTIDQVLAAIKRTPPSEKDSEKERLATRPSQGEGGFPEEAFGSGWTLEMDAALVTYAIERARLKGELSAGLLDAGDLFDGDDTEEGAEDDVETLRKSESQPDLAALKRGTSHAPRFNDNDVMSTSSSVQAERHLDDMAQDAVRARWKVLCEYNALVAPVLPLVDLRQFDTEGHLAHILCVCKGRLFPDTKERLVEVGLDLTKTNTEVPQVKLTELLPGSGEAQASDSVFEQLFRQLHGKASLLSTEGRPSEGRLWQTELTNGRAQWTDGTDLGGMFRHSTTMLCADLRQPADSAGTTFCALLVETPNYSFGEGVGSECLQKFVPSPKALSDQGIAMADRFNFLGVLMGASARTKGFIAVDFPSMIFKFLLQEKIGLHEIREIDAQLASSLEQIASCTGEQEWQLLQAAGGVPDCWQLQLVDGTLVALRGDGTDAVMFAERAAYLEQAQTSWFEQFKPQLTALANGFFSCFPALAARLLTWRELERRVCGVPDVSVDTLKRIARYEGSYSASDPYVTDFWNVLREMRGEQRRQFLGFVWGRTTLPANPTTPFIVDSSGGSDDTKLPSSHTCMFQLHLPRYSSPALLKKMLLLAIQTGGAKVASADGQRFRQVVSGSGELLAKLEAPPPTIVLKLPRDAGHREDAKTFWRRAGLSDDMAEHVQAHLDARLRKRSRMRSRSEKFPRQSVGSLIKMKDFERACRGALVFAAFELSPTAESEVKIWRLEQDQARRMARRAALERQIETLERLAASRNSGGPPEGNPPASGK